MENRRKKIGIMGGTFDPIHVGHLILGEKAYEQLGLDKILFMPAGNPPHKRNREGRASDEQRVELNSCLHNFFSSLIKSVYVNEQSPVLPCL